MLTHPNQQSDQAQDRQCACNTLARACVFVRKNAQLTPNVSDSNADTLRWKCARTVVLEREREREREREKERARETRERHYSLKERTLYLMVPASYTFVQCI